MKKRHMPEGIVRVRRREETNGHGWTELDLTGKGEWLQCCLVGADGPAELALNWQRTGPEQRSLAILRGRGFAWQANQRAFGADGDCSGGPSSRSPSPQVLSTPPRKPVPIAGQPFD